MISYFSLFRYNKRPHKFLDEISKFFIVSSVGRWLALVVNQKKSPLFFQFLLSKNRKYTIKCTCLFSIYRMVTCLVYFNLILGVSPDFLICFLVFTRHFPVCRNSFLTIFTDSVAQYPVVHRRTRYILHT
mgnify:CR=1 FL=1